MRSVHVPLAVASPEMREYEWREFWRRRDPNPQTAQNEALDELLERVREASRRYSNFGAAWRSDRGRVYIRYGQPDKIEKTSDQTQWGEYEIWSYYRLNLTFVFYAQSPTGDYRLVEGESF